jgi:biopolymer transport protein ExbD
MAMNVGSASEEDGINSAINTTPLVDVMLVLLIIFLITIPVVTQSIALSLPKERNVVHQTKPTNINVSVDRQGAVYWNNEPVSGNADLLARLRKAATEVPQPELHIRGDEHVRYEAVGRVLLAAERSAIAKVSFVTEPPPRN